MRPTILPLMLASLLALALTVPGCAHLKTANDIALDACELFAAAHPVEARQLVDRVAPEHAERAAAIGDPDAFDPRVLCVIPAVLDVFLLDQQTQEARLSRPATGATSNTSGDECAPPGDGPGPGAETP